MMDGKFSLAQQFSLISGELCSLLYLKEYDKGKVNRLIDDLNAIPYEVELFVPKNDALNLLTALCHNVKPEDGFMAAKTSHLISSIVRRQSIQLGADYLCKVVSWLIQCLKKCNDIVLPDILHNLQCILQYNPQASAKFREDLIGINGLLINFIQYNCVQNTEATLHSCSVALKCICSLTANTDSADSKSSEHHNTLSTDLKTHLSQIILNFLMNINYKSIDEFLYCKIVISALRILSQLYYNDNNLSIPLPEVMGISHHFVLYGLITSKPRPERLMPAQQTIGSACKPIVHNSKGGKKQKLRKQRNNAMEGLKKEIPVSDRSLMKDICNFENTSAYKPASQDYFDPQKAKNIWALTSDSDMSDAENNREAKLIALKSRVRQSASNLLLVLIKVTEKRDMFGYWWALLPDSSDVCNWTADQAAQKTLAYCAITDPIASSRASVLSVILALLSGSRTYLSQAETSKKENVSFIPFSVSLGYIITCMHRVLTAILETERSHVVILVALKCCAALVQATPYHKMREGLISDIVRSSRKYLVHRDITLQVGALITVGCVLSVDPKVDEVLKSIEKDMVTSKPHDTSNNIGEDDCDDFEEGYSDDELFAALDQSLETSSKNKQNCYYFKSWILDICFKNMGWLIRIDKTMKCKPAAIPVLLESLQVVSAIAFHHLNAVLQPYLVLLANMLCDMLEHEHQDVTLQAARTISIIGDAIQKLEQSNESPPLNQCVNMWEKFITPLSTILQCHENPNVKAVACDCVANIGERAFKELPRRTQMLCCTLAVGTCSDVEPGARAAAVRALAMLVLYRTLRQDIGFVSDCGESILRALAETSIIVRTKAAWALGTLSDALVLNMEEADCEDIDDDLLLRLLEASIRSAADNDKVKMSATRGLGNLLRLIKDENLLRKPQIKTLCERAIEKLLDCACKGTNMKVRWNACYALGNAMKNENLFICCNGWQRQVLSSLCTLSLECKNLKVRINAAVALRAPSSRALYGEHFVMAWRGVLVAMDAAANVDDFTEYKHKDNLVEQLCVTLAHMCCQLRKSDLPDIMDSLVFHSECAKALYAQLYHKLPPENASCLLILQAAKYVTVDLTAEHQIDAQVQALGMLQEIFIWDM